MDLLESSVDSLMAFGHSYNSVMEMPASQIIRRSREVVTIRSNMRGIM